jgi:hypothetical protein
LKSIPSPPFYDASGSTVCADAVDASRIEKHKAASSRITSSTKLLQPKYRPVTPNAFGDNTAAILPTSTNGSSVACWTTRLCILAWPSLIRPGNRLCTIRPQNYNLGKLIEGVSLETRPFQLISLFREGANA